MLHTKYKKKLMISMLPADWFFPDFDFSIADELGHKRQAIAVFSCCLIFQLSFFCGWGSILIALLKQQRQSPARVLQFLALLADDLTPKERQK